MTCRVGEKKALGTRDSCCPLRKQSSGAIAAGACGAAAACLFLGLSSGNGVVAGQSRDRNRVGKCRCEQVMGTAHAKSISTARGTKRCFDGP